LLTRLKTTTESFGRGVPGERDFTTTIGAITSNQTEFQPHQ